MDKLIDSIIRLFLKKDLDSYIIRLKKEQEEIGQKINELIEEPRKLSARYLEEANSTSKEVAAFLSKQLGTNAASSLLELNKQREERLRVVDRATKDQIQYILDLDYKNQSAVFSLETASLDAVKWIGTLSAAILAFSVGFIGSGNYIDIEKMGLSTLLILGLGLLGMSIILCLDYVRRTITRNIKALRSIFRGRLRLEGENLEIAVFMGLRQRFVAYVIYYVFFFAMMSLVSMIILRLHLVSGICFYFLFGILAICLFFYLKKDFLSY